MKILTTGSESYQNLKRSGKKQALRRKQGSSRPVYDASAQALFDRFVEEPTLERKSLINSMFVEGKKTTWWSKLDALWVHAAHSASAGRLNWISTNYNCQPVNNPAFTVDRGFRGNGSTSYLDTQFNPTTAIGANFSQNSGSFGVRSNDSNQSSGSLAGFWDGSKGCTINPRDNSGNFLYRIHMSGAVTVGQSGSSIGMFVACRNPGSKITAFQDGVRKHYSETSVPTSMADGSLRIGAISDTSLRACQFSMGFISGGLTDAEATSIYNWFQPYRTALGIV